MTNANPTYTQNFDGLPTSNTTWANNSTLAGWYYASSTTGLNAGTGSSNGGSLYSFGASGSNERALGSVASGTTDDLYYGVLLKNTGTSNITSITITYTGEQWRNGGNAAVQSLAFAYSTASTTINSGSYTAVSTLDFKSPIHTSSAAALNGNTAANQVAGITATITGLSIAPNGTIMLRWYDKDDSGNDHGLAVDDLSAIATFAAAATAPAVSTTRGSGVTAASFTSGGNVSSDGGSTVTAKGLAWGETTALGNQTNNGTGTGPYTTNLTTLSPNTHYYFKAYATNGIGTSFGTLYDTTTLAAVPGIFADQSSTDQEHKIDFIIDENSNPNGSAGTNTTQYAVWESTTGKWVQANGSLGTTAVWQPYNSWTATANGLEPATQYCFQVKARNNDNKETALGAAACVTTAAVTGVITGVAGNAIAAFCNGTAATTSIGFATTLSAGVYTVQLSNASGSFSSPAVIGSGSASPISVSVPAGTAAGSGYRIRVINGAVISDSTAAFTVKAAPTGDLLALQAVLCPGQESTAALRFNSSGAAAGPFSLLIKQVQANNTFSYTNIASGASFSPDASQLPAAGANQYELVQITSSEGCVNP
ncbi:fibronectin type III domain-containing protein [Taibaiella koreensis]|uniref:fibronectin type III domain-containing protein n=1 Tax=Taibaiella koreensis TaxID=1268548 RepID=UPI0013C2DF4E|nr:fibronectin type III domain-containing protein [Taibaiella koreensis]